MYQRDMLKELRLIQKRKDKKNDKYVNEYVRKNFNKKFFRLNSNKLIKWLEKLACIELYCLTYDWGRGIWKQIDENREILETYKSDKDEELKSICIESWVSDNDLFLTGLLKILDYNREDYENFPHQRMLSDEIIKYNDLKSERTSNDLLKMVREASTKFIDSELLKDKNMRYLMEIIIRHDEGINDINEIIDILNKISFLKNNSKRLSIHDRLK